MVEFSLPSVAERAKEALDTMRHGAPPKRMTVAEKKEEERRQEEAQQAASGAGGPAAQQPDQAAAGSPAGGTPVKVPLQANPIDTLTLILPKPT